MKFFMNAITLMINLNQIHLAGTNGKGSTASIIAKILQNAGQKVELYTSPHLINFNEESELMEYQLTIAI